MPVTAPSKSPRIGRTPAMLSSAATKCISEVPGLEKQVSTPDAARVITRLSAPFRAISVMSEFLGFFHRRGAEGAEGRREERVQVLPQRHRGTVEGWVRAAGAINIKVSVTIAASPRL